MIDINNGTRKEDVLKILFQEKQELDSLYTKMLSETGIQESDIEKQFYKDFWIFTAGKLLEQLNINDTLKKQMLQMFLNRLFQNRDRTAAEKYQKGMADKSAYYSYMTCSFELISGKNAVFWKWLGYLERQCSEPKQGMQFATLYIRFAAHFCHYLKLLFPGTNPTCDFNDLVIQTSMNFGAYYPEILQEMINPVYLENKDVLSRFRNFDVKLQEVPEQQDKEVLKLLKCARTIPGNLLLAEDNEEDMKTIGYLYTDFKEHKMEKEIIAGIFPSDALDIFKNGKLPVIPHTEIKTNLPNNELLHYLEHAVLYITDKDNPFHFHSVKGFFYITGKRIRFDSGNQIYDIPFEDMEKIVLYEALPEILQLNSPKQLLFIRTADTQIAYQILKKVMIPPEEELLAAADLEKVSLEYFMEPSLDKYIFSLQALNHEDFPEEMCKQLTQMTQKLRYLDIAYKNYPGSNMPNNRFITYYIPEVLRLVYMYSEYAKSGISKQQLDSVYSSVISSVKKLTSAASQRVDEIYQLAAMSANADADALQKIIGKDGFTDDSGILKH